MRVSNLKIGVRLWMGFGLVITLMAGIVMTSMSRMSLAEQRVDNILNDRYRKIALATEVKYNVSLIHQHMRNAVIESDAEGVKRETVAMNAIRATNKELLDTFDKIINVPRAREIFDAIIAARKQDLAAVLGVLPALQKPTVSTLSDGEWVAVNTIIEETTAWRIMPQLKAAKAEGIVEYPLNKVVL